MLDTIKGRCPYCSVKLAFDNHKAAPTFPALDQILPGHGYVLGNVQIICMHCNGIKNGMTIELLEKVLKTMRKARRIMT